MRGITGFTELAALIVGDETFPNLQRISFFERLNRNAGIKWAITTSAGKRVMS